MQKRSVLIFLSIFLFVLPLAKAQVGGSSVYTFLNVSASARIAAMGGTLISVKDDDLNTGLQNPAALNSSMDNYLSFSMMSYIEGIKVGDAAYAKDFKKFGTFNIWMHYASYGDFKQTDEIGNITGEFSAADYAFSIGWGYQLNRLFSVGASLKGIYSDYYIVSSTGIAADISTTLYDSTSGWTATVIGRNIGSQLKPYVDGNREPLPIEVMWGVSKKFAHVPARLILTTRYFGRDLTYIDPYDQANYDPLTGAYAPEDPSFWDQLSRHISLGAEILLSKNFHLRGSYNFQRHEELSVDTRPGTVGLSFGFGLKISKFIISYGRSKYHLAASTDHFSIAANLSEFSRKKN